MHSPRFAARCAHFRLLRSAGSRVRKRNCVSKPGPLVSRRSVLCTMRRSVVPSSLFSRVRIIDMSKLPVCLTIAGLDPSGGAGIIADIKTFSAFKCFATAAIASVTYQNTTGVFGAEHQTAESVRKQVEPILADYEIAALKTGMLPTGEIISETARLVSENGLNNFVVDPVVRSTSGFDLIDDQALAVLIEKLFPLSDLITPNIPEA